MISTGSSSNQNASAPISLGGTLRVACIDWFRSGPRDEHGNAVVGAVVTWEAMNDVIGIYQTNVSTTLDNDGHADGAGCEDPAGSGVTDWFCCIGAGKWDSEVPPGKRACNPGTYTARILDVSAPSFTNMTWDDRNSELEASIELVDPKFP